MFKFLSEYLGPVKTAFAQLTTGNSITLQNPLSPCTQVACLATKIINFIYDVSIPIVGIMVLIGGLQMALSSGEPEKFKSGRKTIMYAAIGFGVILIAKGVTSIVTSVLTP